jgi:CheY-like chemotaxis protein
MTLTARNTLLVGLNFQNALTLSRRLHRWRFHCHVATNVRAAREFIALHPVDLVLSSIQLPDGSGYRLLMNLERIPISAFICVPVENSCLWLPAIDHGKKCFGLPALRPSEFAKALEEMAQYLST